METLNYMFRMLVVLLALTVVGLVENRQVVHRHLEQLSYCYLMCQMTRHWRTRCKGQRTAKVCR